MSDSPTTVLELSKSRRSTESVFSLEAFAREDGNKKEARLDMKAPGKEAAPEARAAALLLGNFELIKVGAEKAEAHTPRTSVAPIKQENFAEVAKHVLQKIDSSGYITKTQLGKALEDPSFHGVESQVLASMYKNFDALTNLSHHEWPLSSATITAGDLDKFQEAVNRREKDLTDARSMDNWAATGVKKFARDGKILLADDISSALKNPNTSDSDRKMLELVEKHFSELSQRYSAHWGWLGVTPADFNTHIKQVSETSSDAKLVTPVLDTTGAVAGRGQSSEINYNLYGKCEAESIRPQAIRQGQVGDCYFESALAAVATANPQAIRNAIKDNGDGTYTVTLPGAPHEPLTVKAPTEAELGLYNGGSEYGVWAAVMEKAYGTYRSHRNWIGSYTLQEAADGGGEPGPVIELLTGQKAIWKSVGSNQAEVVSLLEAAFASNPPKAVTTTIYGENSMWGLLGYDTEHTKDGYYKSHVYTITAFKSDGHGGGTLTVRNPWGGQDGTVNGTKEVPLNEFMNNFSAYSIQGN